MNPSLLQLFQSTYSCKSPILCRNYAEPSNNEDDLSIAQPSSRIEETAIFRHLTARKEWHGFPHPWLLQIIISIFPLISHAFPSHRILTFSPNLVRRERLMIHLVRATWLHVPGLLSFFHLPHLRYHYFFSLPCIYIVFRDLFQGTRFILRRKTRRSHSRALLS